MNHLRKWLYPASLKEAAIIQCALAQKIIQHDALSPVEYVAGTDVSHNPRDPSHKIHAAWAVLSLNNLQLIETSGASHVAQFPYMPGYLGFREAPSLIEAYTKLSTKPDLICVDGHGISHPRGLGIASHLGVLLDIPTIGVAKSILVGRLEYPVADIPGATAPLIWQGKIIAMALRTRRRANPVYISIGHRISLETAVHWVQRLSLGYRLPEPTRQAHLAANQYRVKE